MISRSAATAALFGLVLSGCSASGMFKQGAGDAPASDAAGRYAQALARQEQSPDDIENDKNLARDGAQAALDLLRRVRGRMAAGDEAGAQAELSALLAVQPGNMRAASCRRSWSAACCSSGTWPKPASGRPTIRPRRWTSSTASCRSSRTTSRPGAARHPDAGPGAARFGAAEAGRRLAQARLAEFQVAAGGADPGGHLEDRRRGLRAGSGGGRVGAGHHHRRPDHRRGRHQSAAAHQQAREEGAERAQPAHLSGQRGEVQGIPRADGARVLPEQCPGRQGGARAAAGGHDQERAPGRTRQRADRARYTRGHRGGRAHRRRPGPGAIGSDHGRARAGGEHQ